MNQSSYVKVFFAFMGFGPYECYFCHEQIEFDDDFHIHHFNEDKACNHPYNLVPAHPVCHRRYHAAKPGRITSDGRARISAAKKKCTGKNNHFYGKKHSAKTRELMRRRALERYESKGVGS